MAQTFGSIVRRALRRRCPACGVGSLFATFTRLAPTCKQCGWIIQREAGAVTGAMYLIAIVTQLFAAALFFVVWLATDWTTTTKLLVGLPTIAVFSYVALPFARALWVGLDYYTDVAAGETAAPEYARDAYADGATEETQP